MRIRPLATPAEREACVRIALASEPFLTLGWDAARARQALAGPGAEVYVAEHEGDLVGFAVLTLRGAFTGYLQTLCVAADQRGRGYGSALLDFVENRSFEETPNVFLCVSGFNHPARRFYTRHGYELVGELRDYLIPGESELLLRKSRGPIYRFRTESGDETDPERAGG